MEVLRRALTWSLYRWVGVGPKCLPVLGCLGWLTSTVTLVVVSLASSFGGALLLTPMDTGPLAWARARAEQHDTRILHSVRTVSVAISVAWGFHKIPARMMTGQQRPSL